MKEESPLPPPQRTVDFVDVALDLCLSQQLLVHVPFPFPSLSGNLEVKSST